MSEAEKRATELAWCVQVAEDVATRLEDTWPNDVLLNRCERAFRWFVAEIERLEKIAYPLGGVADQPDAPRANVLTCAKCGRYATLTADPTDAVYTIQGFFCPCGHYTRNGDVVIPSDEPPMSPTRRGFADPFDRRYGPQAKGDGVTDDTDAIRKAMRINVPDETLEDRKADQTSVRRLSEAPCDQCGYNGPGYYQPDVHKCAATTEGRAK